MEIQVGVAGMVLPESFPGTYSIQPEARFGYFIREGLEVQALGDVRVWPLGGRAPHSYGIGGSLLWFPSFQEERSFYVLGGAGGTFSDPAGPAEGGFTPLVRAGVGFKVAMTGLKFLGSGFLTMEYRAELHFFDDPEYFDDPTLTNESDFMSGAAIGFSFFR
jgi:hypothetical protein